MESLWIDLSYAFRIGLRRLGLTVSAVLILALGIGATTAIFSVARTTLWKPLPGVEEPDQLVLVGRRNITGFDNASYPNYLDYRDRVRSLQGLAAHHEVSLGLSTPDGARRIRGELVTPDYFEVLGTRPARGRVLTAEGSGESAAGLAVISFALWNRVFGADPSLIGRTVRFNGVPFTVAGIAEPGFRGTSGDGTATEVWVPMQSYPLLNPGTASWLESRTGGWLMMIGRLAEGTSVAEAQAEIDLVAAQIAEEHGLAPEDAFADVIAGAALAPWTRASIGRVVFLLGALVIGVLLVACTNVANLLVVSGFGRARELQLRAAVGADRPRLVRQLLTENVLLWLVGGALGTLLASWTIGGIWPLLPPEISGLAAAPGLDGSVLAAALAMTLVSGALFGIVPSLHATRRRMTGLRQRGSAGPERATLQELVVAAQMAVSVVLLVGAALFARTLANLESVELGFDPKGVAMTTLDPVMAGLDTAGSRRFYEELLREVRQVPGVVAASLGRKVPLRGFNLGTGVTRDGPEPTDSDPSRSVDFSVVATDYFRTLDISLRVGRSFTPLDRQGTVPVAIVNETFVEQVLQGATPLGQRFYFRRKLVSIVGVVADSRNRSLERQTRPFVYVPLGQGSSPQMTLFARTAQPGGLLPRVREIANRLSSEVPVYDAGELSTTVRSYFAAQRTRAVFSQAFSAVAVLLACIGLWGVTAFAVTQRHREVAIRLALGGRRREILARLVRRSMTSVSLGILAGWLAVGALSGLVSGMLFQVGPLDPTTVLAMSALLAAAALAASYFPARRAVQIDPAGALRSD